MNKKYIRLLRLRNIAYMRLRLTRRWVATLEQQNIDNLRTTEKADFNNLDWDAIACELAAKAEKRHAAECADAAAKKAFLSQTLDQAASNHAEKIEKQCALQCARAGDADFNDDGLDQAACDFANSVERAHAISHTPKNSARQPENEPQPGCANFVCEQEIEKEINQVGCGGGVGEEEAEEENIPSIRTIYDKTVENQKFKIAHRNVRIQLTPESTLFSVSAAINDIVTEEMARDTPNDFIGFTINSDTAGREIQVEFKRRSQLQQEDISYAFESVVQSNEQFLLGNYVDIEIITVKDMHGKGKEGEKYKKLCVNNHMIEAQKISDKNKQKFGLFGLTYSNLCLLVAINVAIEHKKYVNSDKSTQHASNWRSARRQNTANFVRGVQELYKKCKLDFSSGATFSIVKEVEVALELYRIVIYDGNSNVCVRYKGYDGPEKKTTLFLHYDKTKKHFNCITKIAAYLGTQMFCEKCQKGVNNQLHKCGDDARCRKCHSFCKRDATDAKNIVCNNCNMHYYSTACFEAHMQGKTCSQRRACPECGCVYRILKKGFVHRCNSVFCQNCNDYMPQPHLCYIKVSKQRRDFEIKNKLDLITAADLETRQENVHAAGVFEHVVNMAHGQITCVQCRDRELSENEVCEVCGPRHIHFDDLDGPNDNIVGQFLEECSRRCERKKRADGTYTPLRTNTILFHYGKAFDHVIIFRHVLDDHNWQVKASVTTGLKILLLEILSVRNGVTLRLVDFFNFCAKPLKALPAAFQLPEGTKKGDWPHLFNCKKFYEYDEPCMPDIKYWNVDNMQEKQRKEILNWHTAEDTRLRSSGERFNFKNELRAYCRTDVTILRLAANKFRNEFLKMGIDAFKETFTLASLCNLVFRRKYYKPKSIGLIPKNGYRALQSIEGLMFLLWRELVEKHLIDSAARQKEVFVHGRPCDGYYVAPDGTITIYEYLGCYWHFCPECFPNGDAEDVDDNNELVEKTTPGMMRRHDTEHRLQFLKSRGYKVVSIWGCQFKRILEKDPQLKQQLLAHPLISKKRINPRDALKGGRYGFNFFKLIN